MPTSAPGNSGPEPGPAARPARLTVLPRRDRGFTLLELMVVVFIVALAAGAVALALGDPAATRLEREAERLALLLEEARAEARASGLAVSWQPLAEGDAQAGGFRFSGLPAAAPQASAWQTPGVSAQVLGATRLVLGPEALLPPQSVLLRLGDRRLELASDGVGPFAVVPPDGKPAP